MEIKIQTLEVDWKIGLGFSKNWRMRATGHVTGPDFITRFELTKIHDKGSRLKFNEGRLFEVNMSQEDRKKLALEIKAYAEKHMAEQLQILVKARPEL